MDEWVLVMAIVNGVGATMLLIERLWRGSRVYATAESVEKGFAVINTRIDDTNKHNFRQDESIHDLQLAVATMTTTMNHMSDSMDKFSRSIDRLLEAYHHGPSCPVPHLPRKPSDSSIEYIRKKLQEP